MSQTVLKVSGMMCGNCQKHVHDVLANEEGVEAVEVSLEKEEVQFKLDESVTNIIRLKEAFKDTNYGIE